MNSRYFKCVIVAIALLVGLCVSAWTEDKAFSITPAVSFTWYPLVFYPPQGEEELTKTESDINNIGMSFLLGLKLFDKVGAHLNLTIDDPTFQKLVDFVGYVNVYNFMLKFDIHNFGGTVRWEGVTPNPIPDGFHFRTQSKNVSLLYNLKDFLPPSFPMMFAIGIGYSSFEVPGEYRVKQDRGLSNSGYGLLKGSTWGYSMLVDTLAYSMELSPEERKKSVLTFSDYNLDAWFYSEIFAGGLYGLGNGEIDSEALAWMVNANGGVPIDGNINSGFTMEGPSPFFYRISCSVGFQKLWDFGKNARIGLALGIDLMMEGFSAASEDIKIAVGSLNAGPTMRLSIRW
jgi:hypothetical protein